MSIMHFGIKIHDKPSNHINKELYLSAKPEGMHGWTEESYKAQIPKADLNFDLNMAYFNSLDYEEFNKHLEKQCEKYKFIECFNLNEIKRTTGIYILVLDQYKQVYIGISDSNMKNRIMSHWNKKKSLERLIFGDICNSILSIDSFGALDTTRIFYKKTYSTYSTEEKVTKSFGSKYALNRTSGGIGSTDTYTDNQQTAIMAVMANRKKRDLTVFLDIERLKSVVSENSFNYYTDKYPQLLKKQ